MATRKSSAAIEATARLSRDSMLEAVKPKRRALPASAGEGAVRSAEADVAEPDQGRFVFIAYAREDATTAADIVAALRSRGIDVKWDRDLLGGQHFRRRLGEMIVDAAAVLVLWSEHSVASDFVIDEAEAGKSAGKLVTCRLGALDDRDIPFGFRQLHCVEADDTDAVLAALQGCGLAPG